MRSTLLIPAMLGRTALANFAAVFVLTYSPEWTYLNYACDQNSGRSCRVRCCWSRSLAGIAVAGPHQGDDATHAYRPIRGRPHHVRLERPLPSGPPSAAAGYEAAASCLDLVSRGASTTITDC